VMSWARRSASVRKKSVGIHTACFSEMQLENRPGVYWSGRVFVSETRFPLTNVFDLNGLKVLTAHDDVFVLF